MSDKPPDNNGLLELLKKLWLPVAGFIGAVTLAYNFYKMWLGDQATVTIVTAGAGLVVIVIVLGWVGFSKKTITHEPGKPFEPKSKESIPRYSPYIRGIAWVILGTVFVGVGFIGNSLNQRRHAEQLEQQVQVTLQAQATQTANWESQIQATKNAQTTQQIRQTQQVQATQYAQATQQAQQKLQDQLIVVVSAFEGPEEVYGLRNEIVESLNSTFSQDEEIEIIPIKDVITPDMGSSYARDLGERYFADLVIWGWYCPTENPNITVHIENLSPIQIETLEESETLEPPATLAQLESFEIQRQLGSETSTLVSFLVGTLKYKSGEYQAAIERFEQVLLQNDISTFVSRNDLFFNLGYSNYELGKFDSAIQAFDKATEIDPEYKAAYYGRGLTYYKVENYERAIKEYDRAIELDSEYIDAYYGRGLAYYQLGNYERAIKEYDIVIGIDPEYVKAYHGRGAAYYWLGNYQRAIQEYDRAIDIDPESIDSYSNRGATYYALGDYPRALQDFTKAIEIDPQFAIAYGNRGNVYYALGNIESAFQDYNKAIELNPQFATAYKNRGIAYQALGNAKAAEADFKKYEELTGEKP
jgi:tetratricopeptide (TPR) repeat protein